MDNVVGSIPEFTDGATQQGEQDFKKVSAISAEESEGEEQTPAEPPAEAGTSQEETAEQPPSETREDSQNAPAIEKTIAGLKEEKNKLLSELASLRSEKKRGLKQDEISIVQQKLDDLNDLNPDDVNLIERVIRSKGYMTKAEAQAESYDRIKNEQISAFLEEFPELKPQNDPNDLNWEPLQRHVLEWYKAPADPYKYRELLRKAYKEIKGERAVDTSNPARMRALQNASHGSGGSGSSRSSSGGKTLSTQYKQQLELGGWSEEEIKEIENNIE